ncbi:hypothetical protein CPLU01_15981 [Colletotrichum plurivorum]|uniref:Retrovirus-related Pol polyprotein from transposon TNT 1-94-like beta-barrel domain-containing protein n=1 Tax=Colletotrichum plurivorum TaxID=2175906 RepID=A0A8H6J3R4_9PEZI|nr:hypothetical protein CPLU01_15981 [Colletotrichum plurivorum]
MERIRQDYASFMLHKSSAKSTQPQRCFAGHREAAADSLWLWDSGANVHMINDMLWFDAGDYAPSIEEHVTQTGNGLVYPTHVGTVTLRFEGGTEMTLKEVLYVQDFPMNIFSGERLYKSGGKLRDNDLLAKGDVRFATIDVNDRGFFLNVIGSGDIAAASRIMATVAEQRKYPADQKFCAALSQLTRKVGTEVLGELQTVTQKENRSIGASSDERLANVFFKNHRVRTLGNNREISNALENKTLPDPRQSAERSCRWIRKIHFKGPATLPCQIPGWPVLDGVDMLKSQGTVKWGAWVRVGTSRLAVTFRFTVRAQPFCK